MRGRARDPYRTAPPAIVVLVILLLVGIVILGVYCYVQRQKVSQEVTFEKPETTVKASLNETVDLTVDDE